MRVATSLLVIGVYIFLSFKFRREFYEVEEANKVRNHILYEIQHILGEDKIEPLVNPEDAPLDATPVPPKKGKRKAKTVETITA